MVPRTRICSAIGPARGLDELGQEGDEEDRDLGVEELDEHALEEELRATADDDLLRLLALEQLAHAEIEQVGGSGVPDDGEGGGRGGDQPGQAGGGGERIRERAGLDAEHRHDARGAALVEAARDDVDDRRAPGWPGAPGSRRRRAGASMGPASSDYHRSPRASPRAPVPGVSRGDEREGVVDEGARGRQWIEDVDREEAGALVGDGDHVGLDAGHDRRRHCLVAGDPLKRTS